MSWFTMNTDFECWQHGNLVKYAIEASEQIKYLNERIDELELERKELLASIRAKVIVEYYEKAHNATV